MVAAQSTSARFSALVLRIALLCAWLGGCSGTDETTAGAGGAGGTGGSAGAGGVPTETCGPASVPRVGGGCCAAGELPLPDGRCLPAGMQEDGCPAGEYAVDGGPIQGGFCVPAGMQDNGCAAGETAIDGGPRQGGTCRPAGVPPEACAEGFSYDGDGGCEPILPAAPCPTGMMAIPGETECREVAPCGDGEWGDIPVGASTQLVKADYDGANGPSNGTAQQPWTKIQDAVLAADDGAIIAVAEGTYVEDVLIQDKTVRLWGRCPSMVQVTGTGAKVGAITVQKGAEGTEIRDIAVSGSKIGVLVFGSENILVDRAWVHDTGSVAVSVEDDIGESGMTLRRSLVESAVGHGVFIEGSTVTIEETVIRQTKPQPWDGQLGRGVNICEGGNTGVPSYVIIGSSVIDGNHDVGVLVYGAYLSMDSSVVRDTQPRASDLLLGDGIQVWNSDLGELSTLILRQSSIENNHTRGVGLWGVDAKIESTTVRATQPQASDLIAGGACTSQKTLISVEERMRRSSAPRSKATTPWVCGPARRTCSWSRRSCERPSHKPPAESSVAASRPCTATSAAPRSPFVPR